MRKLPKLAVAFLSISALCIPVAAVNSATLLHAQSQPHASAKTPPAKPAPVPAVKAYVPLLPGVFSGWETSADPKSVSDPAQVDAANVAALKEYGFTDGVLADYGRRGETLKVKALRFTDASGAYGAYSFYRHSGWPKEQIGTGAASDKNRVLFWIGNVVVDSEFSHVTAMSGSELRDLATRIPLPEGNKSVAPPVLGDLPQKYMDPQTMHYALGPAGYVGSTGAANPFGVLPPDMVGFDRGAEVATATYSLRSGPATLTVINYPTPEMAATHAQTFADYLKSGGKMTAGGAVHPFPKPLQDSNATAFEVRRSGPLVAVVSGDAIPDDAHRLIGLVHFDAETSAIPGSGGDTEIQKTAKLLLAIVTMVIVMFVAALGVALFLGGGRAAYRVMRGKPASSMYDQDFTKLDLE
jgi:hypothetical protein